MNNLMGHSIGKADEKYDKWMKPGWRIEKKYSNKVLIGNWVEERLQASRECGASSRECGASSRECGASSSTHRQDYHPHKDHQPNVIVRKATPRQAQGLPGKQLLGHHGAPHSHYLVSVYGETYGRQTCGILPTLQSWYPMQPKKQDRPALSMLGPAGDLQADGDPVPPVAEAKSRRACVDHIPCFVPAVASPANTCQSAKGLQGCSGSPPSATRVRAEAGTTMPSVSVSV